MTGDIPCHNSVEQYSAILDVDALRKKCLQLGICLSATLRASWGLLLFDYMLSDEIYFDYISANNSESMKGRSVKNQDGKIHRCQCQRRMSESLIEFLRRQESESYVSQCETKDQNRRHKCAANTADTLFLVQHGVLLTGTEKRRHETVGTQLQHELPPNPVRKAIV